MKYFIYIIYWRIKFGKRAASESVRYGSFNSVRQRCEVRQGLPHYYTGAATDSYGALLMCPTKCINYDNEKMYDAFSGYKIHIRFDTRYAVWISCRANVARKSHLIQLGSAHEWSGVCGTGPQLARYLGTVVQQHLSFNQKYQLPWIIYKFKQTSSMALHSASHIFILAM